MLRPQADAEAVAVAEVAVSVAEPKSEPGLHSTLALGYRPKVSRKQPPQQQRPHDNFEGKVNEHLPAPSCVSVPLPDPAPVWAQG